MAFSGDIDAAGLPALRRLAKNVDLLVFNSVVLDAPASPPHLYELHSPPKAIGEVAAEARAGRLLLAHISPAVESQKKAVLASIRRSYKGKVLFAQDGLRLK